MNYKMGKKHSYNSSSQEKVVLVHVEFSSMFQDLGTHLEGEEQLVPLKQSSASVPGWNQRKAILI